MRRAALIACLLMHTVGAAHAAHPGPGSHWRELDQKTKVPLTYFQGMTHDPSGNRYFTGVHLGLYRTDPDLNETGANHDVIPPDVHLREGYNHVGDLSHHAGLLYLPLECYYFQAGNTCKTGSIGVADAHTLQMLWYVKLDPTEIPKAMWAEVSPDGKLLWTSTGRDLLAYDMNDLTQHHAAPGAAPIKAVKRLPGAVPPSKVTGATFVGDRLFLAGQDDGQQIWSVDLTTGESVFETSTSYIGEAEGLDDDFDLTTGDHLPGDLHWQVMPWNDKAYPTHGVTNGVLYHFEQIG
ncbi:MAG TPA: hypothetical protein VNE62_06790 [Actinomycetota bacterium]|nr:hypothetical protein [Actinomycetota bacterium]